jgi:hypothetical protein
MTMIKSGTGTGKIAWTPTGTATVAERSEAAVVYENRALGNFTKDVIFEN